MKFIIILIVIGGLVYWGYSFLDEREVERERTGGSTGIMADYVGVNVQARDSADRTTSLAGLNQTIRQFQSMEGRFPEDLEELVSEGYLPQLPSPPRGQKFDYDAETGEVTAVPE